MVLFITEQCQIVSCRVLYIIAIAIYWLGTLIASSNNKNTQSTPSNTTAPPAFAFASPSKINVVTSTRNTRSRGNGPIPIFYSTSYHESSKWLIHLHQMLLKYIQSPCSTCERNLPSIFQKACLNGNAFPCILSKNSARLLRISTTSFSEFFIQRTTTKIPSRRQTIAKNFVSAITWSLLAL